MGFTENYLALRNKRELDKQKKEGAGKAAPSGGSADAAAGNDFTSRYLALQQEQPKATLQTGLPRLVLPSLDGPTRAAKSAESGASRGTAEEPKGLVLPSLDDTSDGAQTVQTPAWAQSIVDRYKPENNQNIRKNPVAEAEEKKKAAAQSGAQRDESAKPTIGQRIVDMLSGSAKTYGASLANAEANLYDLTQGGRDTANQEYLEAAQLKYDQAKRDYEEAEALALAKAYPEDKHWQKDLEASRNMLEAAERELAAYGAASEIQRGAAQQSYDAADQLAASGQADVDRAKIGLNGLGKFAVDVGVGGLQLGADIAGGIATGGGTMLPLLLRSYGGGAQEARQEGASAGQAAAYGAASALTEALTEKISSLGNFQTKAFGSGALDDILEGVVGAVERIGKTEAGRKALNRAASAGVGFLSEGAEEFVSGIVSPLLKRATYSSEPIDWKETMEEAAYEFLVGGGIGMISGGIGGTDTGALQSQYLSGVTEKANRDAYEAMRENPFSAEARQAARDAVAKMDDARARAGAEVIGLPRLELPTIESAPQENGQKNSAHAEGAADKQTGDAAAGGLGPKVPQSGTSLGSFGDEVMRQLTGGRSGFSAEGREVTRADSRLLENLGKITGSDIRVVSQAEMDAVAGQSGAEGVQLGNRLYISEDAERPMMEVAKHELTHRLQDIAPAEYEAFREYVADAYRADGTLEQYIDSMIRSRENAGVTLTEAQALDEIAADYAGQLLVDEKAVRRLAGENRGLLEKLVDGLREFIEKIKSAFGGGQNAQTEELEQAAKLWQDALEAAGQSEGTEGSTTAKPRFSFGGKNAREADSGSLARAEELERRGAAAEEIRQETGWFRSMDGLWRFEIDDSGMEYSQWGDMRRSDRAEYARFRELERKFIEDTLTAEEQAELRGLLDEGHGTGRAAEQGTLRLADYIKHDELFRNYPQLKGATLRFAEMERGEQGTYSPSNNTITISEELRDAPEDVILHEVQHAIQEAEGFAGGSSPEYWKEQRKDITETIKAARENLDLWLKDIGYNEYVKKSMGEVAGGKKTMEQHWKDLQDFKDQSAYAQQIRKSEEELRNYQEQYDSISKGMTSWEMYRNTAGEIEARDVEGRRTMTAEERRQTAPDLGDENTVFADGSEGGASIGYDQDNRPFVTVEEDILEGVPREDWVRTVKDNLRKKFPNGVTVGNNTVVINNQSRREMTFSRYMQQLMRSDPEIYADKLRATNNADEILRATTNWMNEALLHPRKDAIIDFARGEVQLRVGGNDYIAQVIVGNRGDGNLLLYDVIELEPANIQEKEAKTDYTTKPHTGTGSRQSESASKVSIHQPSQDVKPLRGLQLMDDRDYSQIGTGQAENAEQAAMPSFSEEIMQQLTGGQDEQAEVSSSGELRLPSIDDASNSETEAGKIPGDSDTDRYSMKGDAELKKEVDRLRRQNQRLREQMQRTDGAEMNREAVQRQARELLKEYGSKYDKQTLYSRIEKLYSGIANQTLSESDMRQEARSIAEDILSENREQTNGLYEEYQELRKELRTRGISIAPEYRADLESAGGYDGLRKQYFGKLRLGNNGTAVDQVYDDLAGRYPELFPDDILHPADQLMRITDVLDSLQPVMGNTYEGGMDRAAEYLAGELLERYYDTPEKAPTFADKQARKMEEQRARDREQMLAAVAKERSKRETALQELRDQYQAANRKRIENQNASQRRETIRRHADRLGRMLLRPTDKQHVPEALRGAALELVRQIDTGSNYFLDPDTGKRVYTRDGGQVESRDLIQTRRTQAARELQAQYEKLAGEGGYTVDPDMAEYLDEVANMGDKALGDMSKAELDTVWKVMRVIEHCITKSNDLLGRSRYATVSEMAEKLREQNGGRKDRRNFAGLAGTADQLLNMDMLTPETYFHKLGDAGEDIFRQMRSAADRQTTILKEGVDRAQELVEESGVDLRKAEKDMHTFTTSGGELTLSTAQMMELYALSKREQALEHIYVGGLKPKGARTGKLGLVEAGGAAPVKVTAADVAEIVGALTSEQKQLVDGLQSYLSGDLSRHGNDASMTVYGYEKFKEQNYWPIKVDRNQTKSDIKKEAESKTVAGYGMTKAVKPNARNAVVLRGVLDGYTEHLNQMATYSGWLATSEDVNRVHNFQFTDGEGNTDGTVKTLLEQVYGKGGNSYWDRLMSDVALGTKAGAEPSVMDRGLNQFKAAKVGGNLRVILQQPTAIIRAANMIAPKYFLTAKNPMKGWETAKKYSPIAQWKDWGYFELDTGRSLKELIAGEGSGLETVKNKLMEPAGMADSVAWGHLWNAVENETAEKKPELRRGSEDFYKAAAERFGEVIDRTQVVDSVLHRTQIMRSANSLTRMSTSFMSEPSKIYNMVYRDLYDVQSAGSAAKRAKAGKALARSTAALVVSFAVNAVAQSLPDMWRNDDRDKELAEKFTDAYVSNFVENFDPIGYVPFLKDFESIIQGYSVDRSDLEGFSDVVNALGQMKKAWDGESSKSSAAAALELACKAGDMLGLPMTNVKRDAAGIIQTALQGMGNVEAQYALDKLGLNPGKASATFYDDLYRAMGTDWEQYENIYQDMILRGWDQEKLADNMEKRMAKEAGLEKTSSLPVGYSAPGENLTFDQEVMRQLTGGGSWMDTLPEGSLELARDLEQLEPEEGAESVTKMQKIRELRDSIWGEDVKDLALSNILGDADYDRLQAARKAGISIEKWCDLYEDIANEKIKRTGKSGSPSQEDVTNALKGSGLTEKQKDAIWKGYGWKGEREK